MPRSNPMRSTLLPMTAVLVLSLAACASEPKPKTGDALPPTRMQCAADAANAAIGQQPSAAVVEQARTDAGAKTTRMLRPDQPATLDFRGDRLNIRLGHDGVVKSLDCG